LTPVLDPLQNLVYHAHARDVETVLVDGRVVVDDGRLVSVDALALVDGAQAAATAAWRRFVAKYGGIMAR
jgi:cytosine/adenosine deaminase-related metal-dependent hydrolase